MKCENVYCLYNNEDFCILDDKSLELDIQGKCVSCIYVNIDSDELKRLKNQQLESE